MSKYVIACAKKWFINHPKSDEFNKFEFIYILNEKDLTFDNLKDLNPRFIFFPHWSWKVSPIIYENFECIIFHTAPLPYGRGGSPIQNLILRGFKNSPVCALKMTNEIDGGPIYDMINVSLSGSIDTIFNNISTCIEELILRICKNRPNPIPQSNNIKTFKRLSYQDNELLNSYSIDELYDRIRMVDGCDYKKAYINFGNYKIEFSNAEIINNELRAVVRILNKDY